MNKLKKIIVCLGVLLLIPSSVLAKSYSSLNLEKTLASENIKHDLSNYKETDDQITIYMFRGEHCGHCQNFLNFLNDNIEEYGTYFKLVSFEVWKNENNATLASEVANHFGLKLSGVPFIVIGEKTYQGYSEKYNEEILETIKNYYENKKTYQDVVSPLLVKKSDDTTGAAITIIVVLATASIIGFMVYMAKEEPNVEENKETKQEEKVEIKPVVKEKKETKKEEPKETIEKKQEKQNLPKLKEKSDTNKKSEKPKTTNTPKPAVKKTTKVELPKKKEMETKNATSKEKAPKPKTKKTPSTTSKTTAAKKNTTTVKKTPAKNTTGETKKNSPSKTQTTKKETK